MGLRATLPNHIPACRSEFLLIPTSNQQPYLANFNLNHFHPWVVGGWEAKKSQRLSSAKRAD